MIVDIIQQSFFYRLACRCSEKAKSDGYNYFALRFWGECLGMKNLHPTRSTSESCKTGKFEACPLTHIEECVGEASTDFIYQVGKVPQVKLPLTLVVYLNFDICETVFFPAKSGITFSPLSKA